MRAAKALLLGLSLALAACQEREDDPPPQVDPPTVAVSLAAM